MSTKRSIWTLAAIVALSACYASDIVGPVQASEVSITLSVSGGIAGSSMLIEVDGATREVRTSCMGVCPLDLRSPVYISEEQIAELATRIEEAGFLALNGIDFGTQCCDQFDVVLEYERGDRSSHAEGTESLWPPEMLPVLLRIRQLGKGTMPMLVAMASTPADWPDDPLTLGTVTVSGLTLDLELSYGGGCGEHRIDAVALGGWLESFPVQVDVLLAHDDDDDPCDAVITETRSFGLEPLREAYVDAYGPIGGESPTVILRLSTPGSSESRLVEVAL